MRAWRLTLGGIVRTVAECPFSRASRSYIWLIFEVSFWERNTWNYTNVEFREPYQLGKQEAYQWYHCERRWYSYPVDRTLQSRRNFSKSALSKTPSAAGTEVLNIEGQHIWGESFRLDGEGKALAYSWEENSAVAQRPTILAPALLKRFGGYRKEARAWDWMMGAAVLSIRTYFSPHFLYGPFVQT